MKRRASPLLIGAFVVAALALITAAVIAVAGNDLFRRKDTAVMYFSGSIYGLQVGAPVVFRGVQVGSVSSIEVQYDAASDRFVIPVVAELDRDAVQSIGGRRRAKDPTGQSETAPLPSLLERGLSAQLSMQSLLTGLLYVDLDLRPGKPVTARSPAPGMLEIPTSDTTIQNLKNQLDGMDFRRLAEDVAAIAGSARELVAAPEIKQALQDLTQITASLRQLSDRVARRRVDPLADSAQGTLAKASAAADELRETARRLSAASDHAVRLLAPDSPLVQRIESSAGEVARTAGALRRAADPESPLLQGAERALQDVSRAARSLRELADALERRPESVLRGRKADE